MKNTSAAPVYPEAPSNPSFPKMEEAILDAWREEGTFQASIDRRTAQGADEFVFYDGPPFANGLPHYGHLVTGFVKDLVPRFQTMKGKAVERRFGWDCHGLPAELHSEKELGLSGRQAILKYGMEKFNDHCRSSVMQFAEDWEYYVTREARWVDFENDYKTMDLSYMESVMWAFKTLWDKGLVYEGYRVVPYSWAVQSPLSNFETRLDDSYRMRQDPALTVAFALKPSEGETRVLKLLAWTTTPWTLPSNLALAVAPDAAYAVMKKGDEHLVLAEEAVERYARELEGFEQVETLTGADLVGRAYEPLFPFFADTENAFRVLSGDFIETGEGTGIVHMAPAFGEDDLNTSQANGIAVVDPVDAAGNFTDLVPPYAGMNVFDANKEIIRDLKAQGSVVRHETYDHNYPHCWRTDQPLIYKAMQSWYVKVSAFRDRMAELNQGITWVPGHVRDGLFGNWLANARDWNIGRARFWGAPIPVWKSDDPDHPRIDVYGSLDEIERDFGVRPDDLHRPGIDALTRPNPDDPTGKSTMRRVEDVLDCWFESGSMPFAQVHYPFENKEWFENHFPGDFIVEYVAQTRGWFYTLMVLSTALFDCAPFRACMCHGVVLDEDKQKLSKRLKNYPDPLEVFNTYGADALRWYMCSSPLLVGGDLAMPKDGRAIEQTVRQVLLPLWNAYYFFTLYANTDGIRASFVTDAEAELDRYILGKTGAFVSSVEAELERLDVPGACAAFGPFMDVLNNWYIRRSRERFWSSERTADKQAAYDVLFTVLVTAMRTLAPLLPYLTDHIHRALCDGASVHLEDWPDAGAFVRDEDVLSRMDMARAACSAALSLRTAKNLRVRLPLRRLTIAHADSALVEPLLGVIAEEVNVKEVTLSGDPDQFGSVVLGVDPRIGKRLGKQMKDVMAAARAGDWTALEDGRVEVGGQTIEADEYELRFQPAKGVDAAAFSGASGVVALDTAVDEALEREGLARDFIRQVQTARKEADLHVADRIVLSVKAGDDLAGALNAHKDMIMAETLATAMSVGHEDPPGHRHAAELGEHLVEVGIEKAA